MISSHYINLENLLQWIHKGIHLVVSSNANNFCKSNKVIYKDDKLIQGEQGTEIITQQKSENPAIKFYEHLIHLIEKLMAEKKSILQEISEREKEIQHVRKAFEQLHQHARFTTGF